MKLTLKLAVLFYVLSTACGCIKVPQPCSKNYAFGIPISVTPQDTFIVGDTIWWEMNLPNQLLDHSSGEYIDLTDFELFFGLGLELVDSTVPVSDQTPWFELIEDKGQITQRQNTFLYTYIQTVSTQEKQFRIGCIPSRKGTFSGEIYFPNYFVNKDQSLRDELQIVDPNCEETLTLKSKIIANNKDNNHHMIDGICRYTTDGRRVCYQTADELQSYGHYAFHVKEP